MNAYKFGIIILICCFLIYTFFTGDIYLDLWAEEEAFNARTFPYLIGTAGLAISVLLFILPGNTEHLADIRQLKFSPALLLLGMTAGYGLLLDYLGFIVASFLFLILGFIILGERRIWRMGVSALLLVAGLWFLLYALEIHLSPGLLLQELL